MAGTLIISYIKVVHTEILSEHSKAEESIKLSQKYQNHHDRSDEFYTEIVETFCPEFISV